MLVRLIQTIQGKVLLMRLTVKRHFKLPSLLLGLILVVTVVTLFINVNRAAVNNQLAALDLIPKPELLTELYFNDNANLPTTATSKQAISFTFVIHNLETTDYQYVYDVAVDAIGIRHIVDSGNVLVKNNQYYIKNEKLNLMNFPGRQNVVVELTNIHQSIDFWVANS